MERFIALLRGINVGGRNKIPMARLCTLCSELGWLDVRSYIQSGNLVFRAEPPRAKLENELQKELEREFGLVIPVLGRPATVWEDYVRDNPFPEESRSKPNLVMLALSKTPPKQDAVEKLQERAAGGERIMQGGDALWLYFPDGVGQSKLSPALLDRLVGSPVTMRNWRTVLELNEMSRSSAGA